MNIGWAAPRDGGTGISAYAVRYRVVDSLSWVLAKPVEGRCATLAGLTAGTTYVVAVRTLASNYQMSPWATVTVSTVPAASRAVRPKMVPGQDAVVRVRNAHHRHGGSAATRAARR